MLQVLHRPGGPLPPVRPALPGVADGPYVIYVAPLHHRLLLHCPIQECVCCSEYARALALVASKAPRPAWTNFFCRCANDAYLEEATFHTVSEGIGMRDAASALMAGRIYLFVKQSLHQCTGLCLSSRHACLPACLAGVLGLL